MLESKVFDWPHQRPQIRSGAFRLAVNKHPADGDKMQDPPNLMDSGDAPNLPARPRTAMKTPPPVAPSPNAAEINEQARMLKEYEDQQKALQAAREAEERRRQELEAQQQAEFERRQREQAERERLAQEQLMQLQYNNQAAQQASELEREMLAMRGQYERDQLLLEQYDRVRVPSSSPLLSSVTFVLACQSPGGRTEWHYHSH
jgi:huntingtin-interacting protein 1-related protein